MHRRPERRVASDFSKRFIGHVKLCFYVNGISGKEIHVPKADEINTLSVDRTSWMDLALGRFKKETIQIPYDIDQEYKDQLKAPVRIYKKDSSGNPVGKYDNGSNDDHYAHARVYSEIALALVNLGGNNEDITVEV